MSNPFTKTSTMEIYGRHEFNDHAGNSSISPYSIQLLEKSTTGERINNFHKKKANGELLPHTSFFQTEILEYEQQDYARRAWRTSDPSQFWEWNGDPAEFCPQPHIYHAPDTSGTAALIQRAAANINQSGFDALTASAELGDVIRTFRKIPKRIPDLIDFLRNVEKRKARKAPRSRRAAEREAAREKRELHQRIRELGDDWLTYRYGLRPFVYDLMDLNDAIRNFDHKRRIWSERQGYSYKEVSHIVNDGIDFTGTTEVTTKYTTEHSLRGSVTALVEPAQFQANVFTTAWELVPFSFVLDWVISVGDAIAAACLQATASDVAASWGVQSTTECSFRLYNAFSPKPGYAGSVTGDGHVKWRYRVQERVPAGIPTLPQLKNQALGIQQWLDLGALANARGNLTLKLL